MNKELKEAIEKLNNLIKNANVEDIDMNDIFGGEHIEAINTVLEELNKEKALYHNIRLELTQIKKDLDFEPWSTYKVAGTRLFNIERLLNKE